MFIATVAVTALLAAVLLGSATAKLRQDATVMAGMRAVGVPDHRVPVLAALEIAGALGLLAGLVVWPLGVAAAVGVVAYFTGALVAHGRVRDRAVGPPTVILAVAVAALVLRLLSR
ncbi:MAG: hypothetical protein AVDCRST_MAG35-2276 [uncultured Quadrisphaera sp.]|uniref:Integral membrane protein n=1 Tax=uncultured Quadrisphaera sp. TaxID=904978 RepID=A0A6J4Q1B2_9ACTN|nr:MAG: hypothetical protein AVDCRST_MAG35-2276 [uncultured Quadrisphaera sp.]